MNVWIVNPFDNLPSEGNRPQRYWLMAEAFVRAGHRAVYWTSDFSHATKRRRTTAGNRQSSTPTPASGIEVIQIPTLPYAKNVCLTRIRSHRRLARDFERMALGRAEESGEDGRRSLSPDLIVASTPPLGLCAAALRVARSCGAKFVCDIQDAWPETFGRLLPPGCKWLGAFVFAPMRRTARRIYREADLVTGVCARYAQLAGRSDYHLAYHGISDAVGAASRGNAGPMPSCAPGLSPRRLVYVGNLGQGYDLETVIEAVVRRRDLTLDIAGSGPKEQLLKQRVRDSALEDRVSFHGYLGAVELSRLLSDCDVGVIPMRDDSWVGLPYKLGDYLKAGLPVVSSLHGECGELLVRKACGTTYLYGRVDSLLAALDALPAAPVVLPNELHAECIYPEYVRHCIRMGIADGPAAVVLDSQ